ncbi:hypothetical protein [Paraburkholderia sp. J11-2]|uniref:hypothetical protein n=1 Tax=Paraburkholderia sp. J11-2 TaxID=2805431 RepID=UPI002AB7C443|nr:hypothetical protein [Paraburkholderia sp. J11-2]
MQIDLENRRHCPRCNSQRKGDACWKCGAATIIPSAHWEYPEIPPIDRIRELAKEIGYAIGVHGSQERDLDLIAAPWSEDALKRNYREVMQYIADGLGAKLIEVEAKPLGRRACTIQMDGWYKPIDLSVMPMKIGYELNGYAELAEEIQRKAS